LQPVRVGDTICCYTDVLAIGGSSLTLMVEVWVLREGQGDRTKVTQAEFTFVALDDNGSPRPVVAQPN
jgi:acyl-CoA thioesterase YciA